MALKASQFIIVLIPVTPVAMSDEQERLASEPHLDTDIETHETICRIEKITHNDQYQALAENVRKFELSSGCTPNPVTIVATVFRKIGTDHITGLPAFEETTAQIQILITARAKSENRNSISNIIHMTKIGASSEAFNDFNTITPLEANSGRESLNKPQVASEPSPRNEIWLRNIFYELAALKY